MSAPRGPSGAAEGPPSDLHRNDLPIRVVEKETDLFRVHRSSLGPIFFGPGDGVPPAFRFDSATGRFGVLYVAPHRDAAMIETLLRNPARMTVSVREIDIRSLSVLHASRDLRLVDATGANLSRLGTTAALFTGPYGPCGEWADALFDHPDAPDGILYPSRHNPDEHCMAICERDDLVFRTILTQPLSHQPGDVCRLLSRHGKSLFGAV